MIQRALQSADPQAAVPQVVREMRRVAGAAAVRAASDLAVAQIGADVLGSASQLVVGLLVCFISSMLYAAYSPYIDKNDGLLAQVCQLSLFFVLVSTIALRNDGERASDTLGVPLVVTLFVPPAAAMFSCTQDPASL
jgi:ABC-type Mn2+/Zn2+ transport system permease subunit